MYHTRKTCSSRVLAIFLCLVMVLSMLPMSVLAAEPYTGVCGENLTWSLDAETGTLTISGTGEMDNYEVGYYENAGPWSESGVQIKKLVVEEGVTSIGANAFGFCGALLEVSLPSTLERIDDFAFGYCVSMTDINVPVGTQLSNSAFDTCTELQDEDGFVIINGILYEYFYDSENPIAVLDIPDGVTTITGGVVSGYAETLTRVEIPASVTCIATSAFAYLSSLTDIVFEGDAPVIMYNAFTGVTAQVTLPEGNTTWNINNTLDYGGNLTWPETFTIGDDNKGPVATNVAVKEVAADRSTGEKTLYLTFNVTDTEGDVLWNEPCDIGIVVDGVHDPEGGETFGFASLEKQADGSYLGAIRLNSNWCGDFTVRHIYLADQFGNGEVVSLDDHGVTGTIPKVYTNAFTVGDFTLNGSTSDLTVELSVNNQSQDLTFKAPLTMAEGANFPAGELWFYFRNTTTGKSVDLCGWAGEEDGAYYVTIENISVDFSASAGTYTLERMVYAGMDVTFGSCPTFTVTKVQTDFDVPVLKEIWFTVNDGEKVIGNFTVKEGDQLKAYAKIDEASAMRGCHIDLCTYNGQGVSILLTYDETLGLYVGTLDEESMTNYMENTVWFVDRLWAEDIFCNNTQDYSMSTSHFFAMADSEGNYTSTPVDVYVWFEDPYSGNSVGFEYHDEDGITTLGEIMQASGTAVTPPAVEGLTFQGWHLEYLDRIVTEDEYIFLKPYESLSFLPMYDKIRVSLDVNYINADNSHDYTDFAVVLPYGSTYADLLAEMENFSCVHTSKASFVGWTIEETLTDEIPMGTNCVRVSAQYDKVFVNLEYQYVDTRGDSNWESKVVVLDKEVTVAELKEYFLANLAPGLTHCEALGSVTWVPMYQGLDETVGNMDSCGFEAEYEKSHVNVSYSYINQEGYRYNDRMILTFLPGATWADVIASFRSTADSTLTHFEGIGDPTWIIPEWVDIDPAAPAENGGYIELEAGYDKMVVAVSLEYQTASGGYGSLDDFLVLPNNATYGDAIDAAMALAEGLEHPAILGAMTGWEKHFEYGSLTDPLDTTWMHFSAQYEKIPVRGYVYYINAKGETVEEITLLAMEEGDTYQDAYNQLNLNVTHTSKRTFLKWEPACSGGADLTGPVKAGEWVDAWAVYDTCPVQVTCSYLGDNGKVVTSTFAVNLNHGDNVMEYINSIAIPDHARASKALGWALDPLDQYEYINLYVTELHLAVMYEDMMPVYTNIHYLGEGVTPTQLEDMRYLEYDADGNGEAVYEAVRDWLDEATETVGSLSDPQLEFDRDNLNDFGSVVSWEEICVWDEETQTDVPTGVYYMSSIRFCTQYDKNLLIMIWPDGSEETKLVDGGTKITLPETHNGKALVWVYDHVINRDEYEGGKAVTVYGPYGYMIAKYADGSEYVPEGVQMEQETVDKVSKDIADADTGDSITVDMSGNSSASDAPATILPSEILGELQGKDVDLTLDMGGYSWTINGADIEEDTNLVSINMEVKAVTDAVPEQVVDTVVTEDEAAIQISLTHEGEFKFKAALKYYVGTQYAGKNAKLYYYVGGALQLMDSGVVDAQGYVTLDFDHASDYVIAVEKPAGEPAPAPVATTPMYRLYNPNSGEHFYTGSTVERDMLADAGWHYEGIAWNAPTQTGAPVHRLYNPNSGDHHYTMSADERDMLVGVGWIYEGVAWNSADPNHPDSMVLYRLYNPNADCGSHHYTGSKEERDFLVSVGWIYEGIGWFGMVR